MKNTNIRCDDMTHCQWCVDCSGLTGALGCVDMHYDIHGDCTGYSFVCAECAHTDRCMICEERRASYYQNMRNFYNGGGFVGVCV